MHDNDYEIDNLNDESNDSDSDTDSVTTKIKLNDKNDHDLEIMSNFDPAIMAMRMKQVGFRSRKNLVVLTKSFQFKQFGIQSKVIRKLLCRETKRLVTKYPKIGKRQRLNMHKRSNRTEIEGNVDSTK